MTQFMNLDRPAERGNPPIGWTKIRGLRTDGGYIETYSLMGAPAHRSLVVVVGAHGASNHYLWRWVHHIDPVFLHQDGSVRR